LGGLFIAVTLLLPRGIIGTLEYWRANRADRRALADLNALPQAAE
jgi:hypothetical protein